MLQKTLKHTYTFEGKGLHTGKVSVMKVGPAPAGSGITFRRTDLEGAPEIHALGENVSNTARSTVLSENGADIHTVEHLLSCLTGLGVDNALIELDNVEAPILDGSARFYAEVICADGLVEQNEERKYINIDREIEIKDEKSGSWIRISPAESPSYDITVDFNSRVLGVQSAHWDPSIDFATEIAPCRTFVFFHEIEFLFANNLIKGGDVDNAIVIVEHPVEAAQLERMGKLFNQPELQITEKGYLNNLNLHFPNECGRHKLLDLIGDLRLTGGFLNARIEAYKPGHALNSRAAYEIRKMLGLTNK